DAAQEKFPSARVMFAPDMALGNGHLERVGDASIPIVVLKREDSEASGQQIEHAADLLVTDWHWRGFGAALAWRGMRAPEDVSRVIPGLTGPLYELTERGLDRMAARNVREAVEILSQGRVVVTDRLHAMVLACLLQIPVFAFDNANGKVGALYRDYLHELPVVVLCASADAAVAQARSYVAGL
ncbi:MAG: polysaccharide pyruvyl transferase family protein, partial [Burkholderiales bacterium]